MWVRIKGNQDSILNLSNLKWQIMNYQWMIAHLLFFLHMVQWSFKLSQGFFFIYLSIRLVLAGWLLQWVIHCYTWRPCVYIDQYVTGNRDGCSAIIFVKHVKTVFLQICHSTQSIQCRWINCRFVVKAPANAIMQHKQHQLVQNQFWHVLQNWLLCSHPWPNMIQCTILKIKRKFRYIVG